MKADRAVSEKKVLMNIWELIFFLFSSMVMGYFILRGIKLIAISGFCFHLPAEAIEYTLPALLIFTQSFIVELSGIAGPWRGFLAVGFVIAAGAHNIVVRQRRKIWEQHARKVFPDRWSRWSGKPEQAIMFAPVDRLFRYTSMD
jgi:hypothetical protein